MEINFPKTNKLPKNKQGVSNNKHTKPKIKIKPLTQRNSNHKRCNKIKKNHKPNKQITKTQK
jgi:hypothetical protein